MENDRCSSGLRLILWDYNMQLRDPGWAGPDMAGPDPKAILTICFFFFPPGSVNALIDAYAPEGL